MRRSNADDNETYNTPEMMSSNVNVISNSPHIFQATSAIHFFKQRLTGAFLSQSQNNKADETEDNYGFEKMKYKLGTEI